MLLHGCIRGPAQSCLMQDEPEGGACFSYKMSLKERIRMLGIDHQHGRRRNAEPGADPGVSGRQRRVALPGSGTTGGVRLGEPDFAATRVRALEARGQGTPQTLYREDDGVEPGAGDAPDWKLSARRRSTDEAVPAASFSSTLHARRHRTAGSSGRGPRDLEWPSHAEDSATGAA